MGIIQRQALRTTIVTFAGVGVGVLSRAIMPFILEKDQIGALNLLDSVSLIIATIATLGFTQITLRLFPDFRNDKEGHSGYLIFGLILSTVGIILGLVAFYFLKDFLLGTGEEHKTIQSIAFMIFPIIVFRVYFMNTDIYLRMLSKSVIGAFWEGFVLKFFLLFGILAFWLNYIDFEYLAIVYTVGFCLPGLMLTLISFRNTQKISKPEKRLLSKEKRREMFVYGGFGLLGMASGTLIKTVDSLMVNQMLGEDALGVYAVLFLGGILVSVPARGVRRIAVPLLSESWKENDMKNISDIYKKSALNQVIIGFYLLIVGWACVDEVLTFLPDYQEGLYVFLFIGLAQLLEMSTGVNMEVIATSEKYKMNTYFNVALVVLTIVLNYLLINLYALPGAALASMLSILLVNIARWYYLKKVFTLQPFDARFIKAFFFGAISLFGVGFLSFDLNPILSAIIQFMGITIVYWFVILRFSLSEDISNWMLKMKKKFL